MTRSSQPNVIVFFTDQQRWDCSGLHGNTLGLMPNFDRMAREGTHIAHSFTCQPVCGPARSSLQTGCYATRTGCWRNGIPLPRGTRTLAHAFNEAGYHTGYIGKWHLAPDSSLGPVPEADRGGYREWLASNILELTSHPFNTVLFNEAGQPVKLPGYRVDALADAAIRFVDRHQSRPFYLFPSFIEPHQQNDSDSYPAPPGYDEMYASRSKPPDLRALVGSSDHHLGGYYGMVKRLDEALGRLRDALRSLGLEENTILLFTSDHGCHFKTRNAEYKRSCHDVSIRVPTAFSGPGFMGIGTLPQLVSLVDLPPTLLGAAGLSIPPTMQGNSLIPLLRGQTKDWPDEVLVQISESQVGRAIRTTRWKYSVVAPGVDGSSAPSSNRYKEDHLYDLASDPYELNNLVGSPALRAVAGELRRCLLRRLEEAGEDMPEILAEL